MLPFLENLIKNGLHKEVRQDMSIYSGLLRQSLWVINSERFFYDVFDMVLFAALGAISEP